MVRTSLLSVALAIVCFFVQPFASAQTMSPDGAWTILPSFAPAVENETGWVRPARFQALALDRAALAAVLAAAPLEGTPAAAAAPLIFGLPDPQGVVHFFKVAESPVMEPGLAAQFPEIRTYVGQGITHPAETLRMDLTPQGFHAQVLGPTEHSPTGISGGAWYIDPYSKGDDVHYGCYYKRHLKPVHRFVCEVNEQTPPPDNDPIPGEGAGGINILTSGPSLRTYRLACAATAEYTAFHGGTVALGQAAIVTAVNRVTGVYETELAVRLTLVANNSNIVYTDSGTDPYSNGSGSTMLGQNQTTCTNVIGSANYDIGHVFSTGGGGIAGLGVVCSSTSKARGVTGLPAPTGDAFWIDFVAHEMGHQFGANHSFNGTTGNCSGNRNASTAMEPGSGSTIMSYAGICGADDLQPNSDPYFSFISLQEIRANVEGSTASTCGTSTATGNSAPTISAPGINGLTIPIGTPFALTASGSDPNGDALTYSWEERDQESTGRTLTTADNGAMPLFRVFNPSTSPTRTFPQLSKILNGTSNNSEKLPVLSRGAFRFTVTARDNRAGGGGVERADVSLIVNSAAGPFAVTSPASPVSWAAGTTQTVTWNVAGTTANGVNCANVRILLSTNGGTTFPITLLATTPNTGTASFVVPNNQTTTGRIRVEGVGNVFFNIGAGTVTITAPVSGVVLTGTGANTISDTTGNGNANGRIDPGESAIGLVVQISNGGTATATGVSATLTSSTPTATVTTGSSPYPNLGPSGGAGVNSTPFVLNVSSAHPCGTPIALSLAITSTQGTGTYNFSLQTGQPGGISGQQVFTYAGGVVAIPDSPNPGVNATLNVSGLTGTIADIDLRFDGTTCNATVGSTTVGLDHTWLGDLVITLTSPSGTVVTLANRPGATGNGGNNLCHTILDDEAAAAFQSITSAGNPWTGSYIPAAALGAFDGQSANGIWTLNVTDLAAQDTGNIRAFSVLIRTNNPAS
ncbi:MAG: reprolysin-like metallopeptidase, partial [Phycisphaerales bacterium]